MGLNYIKSLKNASADPYQLSFKENIFKYVIKSSHP